MFPLFFFRDHCQSAKASGTFCSPSRRILLWSFAHITQCCRFEALLTRAAEYRGLIWRLLRCPWSEQAALKASPP